MPNKLFRLVCRPVSLNLQDNKTSYYVKPDEWEPMLVDALAAAIRPASVEVLNGRLRPSQLSEMIDKTQIIITAQQLLALTYEHSASALLDIIDEYLILLPGGEDWFEARQE